MMHQVRRHHVTLHSKLPVLGAKLFLVLSYVHIAYSSTTERLHCMQARLHSLILKEVNIPVVGILMCIFIINCLCVFMNFHVCLILFDWLPFE